MQGPTWLVANSKEPCFDLPIYAIISFMMKIRQLLLIFLCVFAVMVALEFATGADASKAITISLFAAGGGTIGGAIGIEWRRQNREKSAAK
jgi:hypothetical protein